MSGPLDAFFKPSSNQKKRERSSDEEPVDVDKPLGSLSFPLNLSQYIADPKWHEVLSDTLKSSVLSKIEKYLAQQYAVGKKIFPPTQRIFEALNLTPFDEVKVVLLGQDPYHGDGQAHGLCFSVLPGIKPPPSLNNMYKEMAVDVDGFEIPNHGFLESWAGQGVLMLNATLTVEAHNANSHSNIGWQLFTDRIIQAVSSRKRDVVFLLWGGFAQKKGKIVDRSKHCVIECAHPSPLSVKHWVGCKTFSKCNEALTSLGKPIINWKLPVRL